MKHVGLLVSAFLVWSALGFNAAHARSTEKSVLSVQQQAATGVVTDEQGVPIPGVNVLIKGTTQGAVTDIDGKFNLPNVPNGATLVVSSIGYATQEVTFNGQPLTVVLAEAAQSLDEIVVVGYGSTKKVNLTGSVASVDGDVLAQRPISNIGQGLQGVVPNLNISMNSGGAPGAGSSFNVRGTTSLNGGSPLVLVDNVQMDPNLVNPDDIASVTVLKDAASAAIYGARAAYGVILITTKQGRKESRPTVSFNATTYWQKPAFESHVASATDYLKMLDTHGWGGRAQIPEIVRDYINRYANGTYDQQVVFLPELAATDASAAYKYQYVGSTDWWDEVYGTGFSQIYNVALSGGTEKTTYYASASFNDEGGIVKQINDKYQKYNANVNVSSDITKWLNVSARIMNTFTDELHPTAAPNGGISAYGGLVKNDLSPLMPVYHPDGHFAGQGGFTNPRAVLANGGSTIYKKNDLWMSGAVKLTPFTGFTVNADYTWNTYNYNNTVHVQKFLEYTAVPGTETYFPHTLNDRVQQNNSNDYYHSFNLYAEYATTFAKNNNLKLMVGYNQEKKTNNSFWAQRTGLINQEIPMLGLATGDQTVGGSGSHWAVDGLFARINYDYAGKYLLELNGRYDGSSRFAKGKRYAFFPSVSAAWRMSEESFWEGIRHWWSNAKIRASYGSLGNQALSSNFPYLATYGINTSYGYLFNGARPVAVTAPGLVDANFTWETVNQVNVGVDLGFLANRLEVSYDWYQRNTFDMLTEGEQLPSVLGASVPQANAADMKTVGWELSIAWNERYSNGFSWHARGVLSDYIATITKFENPTGILTSYFVGDRIGDIWGYTSNGLFQTQAEIDALGADYQKFFTGNTIAPGDVKFEDLNGDGKIDRGEYTLDDHGDLSVIGNTTPRYQWGLSAGFEYKGFDFEMFWAGVGQRNYFAGGFQFWGLTGVWDVPRQNALDYWTPENTGAYMPRPSINTGGMNRQTSSRYMQNVAYGRLKNVVLGYTLPKHLTEKANISRLRIFLQGENLFTFSGMQNKYADPENLQLSTYPINKKYSIGLNLTF